MEKSLIVLLLLCAVSSARRGSPEEESPQDSSDFHAVLREMTAALAEHKVKIEQLQTLNQEQAAKLKELEKQTREVDTLKREQEDQAAELRSLKSWANGTGNQVDTLWRDRAVGQVAFSASMVKSGPQTIGPFSTVTPLVFRYVFLNIGDAYNQHTGIFTAPVRGAYHFEAHIGAHGHSKYSSQADLVMNGKRIVSAHERQTNGFGKGSNGAILLLKPGDVVFLRMGQNCRIYDSGAHHSTFSGHLLFPM